MSSRWMLGLLGLAAVAFAVTLPRGDAVASVSIAETWDALLHDSSAVAVVTALDAHGVWENGRIYTYTRVHVDRAVAGELATGAEALVRTMGGEVGDVGQRVEGEAAFPLGSTCLVFAHPSLAPAGAGSFVVTARAQGQFPVDGPAVNPSAPKRLLPAPSPGALVRPQAAGAVPPRLVAETIPGRFVEDVAREVAADWPRLHPRG